jgi:hypothetical protein
MASRFENFSEYAAQWAAPLLAKYLGNRKNRIIAAGGLGTAITVGILYSKHHNKKRAFKEAEKRNQQDGSKVNILFDIHIKSIRIPKERNAVFSIKNS